MALIEVHHHHYHFQPEKIVMALSKQFQAQLDRLAALVSADRSNQAVTIAQAVAAQAEADQKAIADANAALETERAAHAADAEALRVANASLTEEVAALQAALDAANAPAAPAETTSAPAGDDSVAAPAGADSLSGSSAADVVSA